MHATKKCVTWIRIHIDRAANSDEMALRFIQVKLKHGKEEFNCDEVETIQKEEEETSISSRKISRYTTEPIFLGNVRLVLG